ncbi:MAG: helix-turn-helix domain-containing protein, partial [Deltaproteobacteria bacterium]|nr:helix-turn-helix domain-containing protein [Deltaproteobacteria bacterium]
YLGHVEHDDAVWVTARRRRPLLIDAPTCKSARDIERVARRTLAALGQQQSRPRATEPSGPPPRPGAPLTLYDVLGISRAASDDEIRRAYKRQREIFREDSLPIVSLVDAAGMRREQARIEEAYDTLLDPVRKQAYDLSIFPEDDRLRPGATEARSSASEAELAMLQAELGREITPETAFSGALLRKAREAQGLEIGELAQATKVAPAYLRALEAEQFATLPADVYVRGFLQLVAKAIKLDPTQVVRTYMKRLRALQAEGDD